MLLTVFAVQRAAPKSKPYKLADGRGLHLLVNPNGTKLWRFRYHFAEAEKMMALGRYPEVSLAAARARREEARTLIAEGRDPAEQKKLEKLAAAAAARNTFGAIADEYLSHLAQSGRAQATLSKTAWCLRDLASILSPRPISEITPAEVLQLLKKVEQSGRRETARRLRVVIGSVFRYAIVTMRATNDPTYALRGALLRPIVKHRAAILEEKAVGSLIVSIEEFDGWPTIRAGLQLLALTMTRPGDVRHMRRSEIIFPTATWRIPAERMKMRRPHDVPLSRQALAILQDIWQFSDDGGFVFPSLRSKKVPLSENAFNSALRRMGYTQDEMTAHGFRATASTILNERGYAPDVIEAALAHQDDNAVRRAYNRATYWPERIKLMQEWADLLDSFKRLSLSRAA